MTQKLILFFTRNTGLQDWKSAGILDRELRYYKRLMDRGFEITFVSYDRGIQNQYARVISPIKVIYNRFCVTEKFYLWWIVNVYGRIFCPSTLVKTNQIIGGGVARRFASVSGSRLVVRAGHLPSDTAVWQHGRGSEQAKKIENREKRILQGADQIFVTTDFMRATLVERYQIRSGMVHVVPNYVDTELFHPESRPRADRLRAGFVGRLEAKKNVIALIEAFEGIDADLEVVGDGSLRGEIDAKAQELGVNLIIRDRMPNNALPEFYASLSFYIQPSHLEHHPKTLIEAMACGLPVIASNRKGNRELIDHMRTGILCETDPGSIREAIVWLFEHPAEVKEMGRSAREFVVNNFSLDKVVETESRLLSQLSSKSDGKTVS